jgi:hypothetical protein
MAQKNTRNVLLPTIALPPELAEQLDVTLERVRAIRAFQPPTKASLVRELLHRGMQALEPEVQQAESHRTVPSQAGNRDAQKGKRSSLRMTGTATRPK